MFKQTFFSVILLICVFFNQGLAQEFLKNENKRALNFKEIQLQFANYSKSHDLKNTKQWKFYKRYEYEMQMHTNGRGEPDGFEDYINAALEHANQPAARGTAAGVWAPFGTSNVPTNLQGYAPNGIGRINCVAFHPTDTNTYYVGVAQGGLWKTTNGGTTYIPLTDNLPITRISDITLDPNDPNTIYISVCDFEYIGFGLFLGGKKRHTHFGLGVYKSTDAGQTWTATGLTFQLTNGDASLIRKIIVNPANSQQVLACGVSGIYRSVNGGLNWNKQADSLFWDMTMNPQNSNIVYAASGWVQSADIGSAGIYQSNDFGLTWNLLNTGIPPRNSVQRIRLAIAPTNTNMIYALACDDLSGLYGVYQSTTAGQTWTFKPGFVNVLEYGQGSGSGGQGTYDLGLCVSDTNENVIYTGGINLWGSLDGGTNFSPISHWTFSYGLNTIHADVHDIRKQPGTNSIFVCCDGGLYKTRNITLYDWTGGWPTIWKNMSNGMQISSFYRVSSSKNTKGRVAAGAQDNSTFYYNGTSWSTVFGGDGMDNYLNPLNNLEVIGSSQYGTIYYSSNDGANGSVVGSNPNGESSEWVTPIAANYQNPGIVYAGNENVVRSNDDGQNWTSLGTIFSNTLTNTNTEISALCVSPANKNALYAARRVRYELNMNGVIIRSLNAGSTFSNVTGNLPDTLYYTGIETSATNSLEVVVCMAGFANGCKVFKSTAGGGTWANISYNLPNVPVNCIKYVEGSKQLIVATDMGLYYLNNNSPTWISYSAGLPNVIASDIEFNVALNKMYVSTFGRGIWETSLSALKVLDNVGIEEQIKNQADFKILPSINKGEFTIQSDEVFVRGQLEIIDVLGKQIYAAKISGPQMNFNLALQPGAYYLKLESEGKVAVRKMVVQ